MPSATLTIPNKVKEELKEFAWVNWSEVGREEAFKKGIFERFIKTGTLSGADQEFCDKIGWYPIDELELKEEYIEKLKESIKKPTGKSMTVEEFNKWCDSL